MKTLQRFTLIGVMLSAAATGAFAQTIHVSCTSVFWTDPHQRIACLEALLSQEKYHFTLASLPPSNGFGPGLVLIDRKRGTWGKPARNYELDLSATGAVTTNSSWFSGADVTLMPSFNDHSTSEDPGELISDAERQWQQSLVHAGAAHRSVRTLYFYGSGSRSPSRRYVYSEDDTYGDVDARIPITRWLVASGKSEVRASSLPGVADPTAVALNFAPAAIPGITAQPIYLNNGFGVETKLLRTSSRKLVELPVGDPHYARLIDFEFNNNIGYGWHQPSDGSSFAYRQFRFDGDERAVLRFRLRNSFHADQHPLAYLLCQYSNKKTDKCNFGQIDIKSRLILSQASGANQVPFYLQPTLGGTDIEGNVTLRGYDNYRFRGPDVALLQFEYGVPVWDPFGVYVFYDVGTVGSTPASLSLKQFRQDGGFGLSVRLRGNVVAQTYYAFGAGHGGRWNYNFAKTF